MPSFSRRSLLKTASRGALAALAAQGACLDPIRAAETQPAPSPAPRRLKYVGWQVGVTYQATSPGGLARDDMMRMLDAMARHRMNLLSLQMLGYAHFDPKHDGYCWPVSNPKLRPLWDATASQWPARDGILARGDRIGGRAGDRSPDVHELGDLESREDPPELSRCRQSGVAPSSRQAAAHAGLVLCAERAGIMADRARRSSRPVDLLLPHECHQLRVRKPLLPRLFLPPTQEKYRRETGKSLLDAPKIERDAWSKERISKLLKQYVEHLRRIRPHLDVWLHTRCTTDSGHDPKRLPECGFNFVLPHTFHFPITQEKFHATLRHLEPNRCVLHFSARDVRPTNYPLWIQTPESIAEKIGWVLDYPGENLAGILFYNPNAMSPRNVRAVYEQIRRFDW